MGSDDVRRKAEALIAKADSMAREYGPGMLHGYCGDEIAALRAALAAPATVDAGAMQVKCIEILNEIGDDDMASDREIAKWERAIEAIRALPLPAAPASGAVEEARKALVDICSSRVGYLTGHEAHGYMGRSTMVTLRPDVAAAYNDALSRYEHERDLAAERADRGGKGA